MYVDFVSDEHYKNCVRHVLNSFKGAAKLKSSLERAIAEGDIFTSDLFKKVVDPFKMTCEIERIGIKEWIKKEILRQLDKTVEQKMGEFHQKLLGGVAGWEDWKIGRGIDLANPDKGVYIEVKNKFNTCSASALNDVRQKLEQITSKNHKAKAYWGYVIGTQSNKTGEDIWEKTHFNRIENVRKVWGEALYELITGDAEALQKVYHTLPQVIADVAAEDESHNVAVIIDDIVASLEDHFEYIQSQIYTQVFKA